MSEVQRGCFITLEGGEGVGKTTNLAYLTQQLQAASIPWIATREPGGTPLAERIRDLLLANDGEKPHELTELLLMFAARAQHLEEVIKPALAAGTWVVCDRFTDATYAYQGRGRGQSESRIHQLEKLVQENLEPDLTFLLDMPVEAATARVAARGQQPDRFEQEHQAFFQRVREGYLNQALKNPLRFRVINADQSLEAVQKDLKEALIPSLLAWKNQQEKEGRDA
ncbi:dTMP kinase [Marinospirillum celere]|uniref:Thymidylate kinase n=1 Tax=Marinospirillum celere TaxID=1122252 RepID=A0A1I1EVS9_9GAMM|nr:dTMP kinase [Marinospirillum celere]SFB91289.1 dTMP kinase [Marinospirillum celere]